jgi:hypothetical protein
MTVLPLAIELNDSLSFGELIVGFGTLSLACFTAWLGFETRASAKASQASAKAAEEAVEASEEPFVIATPTPVDPGLMKFRPHEKPDQGQGPPQAIHRSFGSGGAGSFVRLRLWNIGQGPAIVTAVQIRTNDGADLLGDLHQHYAVGAGGPADIEIPSPRWVATPGDGVLTIDYFRASGVRYRTSSDVSIGDPTMESLTYRRTRLG